MENGNKGVKSKIIPNVRLYFFKKIAFFLLKQNVLLELNVLYGHLYGGIEDKQVQFLFSDSFILQ